MGSAPSLEDSYPRRVEARSSAAAGQSRLNDAFVEHSHHNAELKAIPGRFEGLRRHTDLFLAFVTAGMTVGALAPVWTTSFGFLDDYSALYSQQTEPGKMRESALLQGRPIAGILHAAFFSFVDTIGELAVMRAFSVACLAIVAMLMFVTLRRFEYGRLAAWVFAVGMLWLPGTQVMASWAILLMGPAAMVLAVIAARSFSNALDRPLTGGPRLKAWVLRLVPSITLLSAALCAYQPAAMVFWPVVFLFLLAPSRSSWSLRMLAAATAAAGVVGAAAAAVGYAVLWLGTAWVDVEYSRTALVGDIDGKVDYLASSAFPRVFDPWALTPRPTVALVTLLALVLSVPLAVRGSVGRRLGALALFSLALPLSYLPSVVTAENWASARSLVAAFVVPLAGIALVVQGLPSLSRRVGAVVGVSVAGAVGVFAFSSGHHRVSDYFATPGSKELSLGRAQVRPKLDDATVPIAVVRSDYTNTLAPGFSYDEFGIPSTYAAWVPVPFTQILAHEQTARWLPEVTLVERADVSSLPATTLVIDYGHLLDPIDNAVVYRGGMK